MAALTKDRKATAVKGASRRQLGVAAAVKCYRGGLAVKNASGYVQPGTTATGLKAIGRFVETVDNTTGANGDETAKTEAGVFSYENSAAGDLITIADIGNDAYIVDDQTVAKTDGTATRSIAGEIFDLADGLVWVKVGL